MTMPSLLEPDVRTGLTEAKAPALAGQTGRRLPAWLRVYMFVLAGSVAAAILLRAFVIHAYRIPSSSMEPTLFAGDCVLAERITYGATLDLPWLEQPLFGLPALGEPRRGDVVIFRSWGDSQRYLIKRCVGLPGDTVQVAGAVLLVNGRPFDALVDGRGAADDLRDFGPHVVRPGHIFVLGDNRAKSDDSRSRGDVPLTALRGRPLFVYWSVDAGETSGNPFARVRWSRIGHRVR